MASGSHNIQASNTSAGFVNQSGTVHVAGDVIVNPRSQTESPDFSLPRLVPTFRGRDDELAELERLFFQDKAKKVAICGLPGMGKSELAKQFAKRCEEKKLVEHVFWINAENKESLDKSSSFLKVLYQNYRNFKCMFVFDNTVNRKSIFEVEPLNENTDHLLLITSQIGKWQRDVKSFGLSQLGPDCAIEVFRVILDEYFNDRDRDLYLTIAEIVNYIPLGLQVTAAQVRLRMIRMGQQFVLQKYVKEITQDQDAYIDLPIADGIANPYEKSLFGAIKISINYIKSEKNLQLRDLALNALFVCAYLDPDNITLDDLLLTKNIEQLLTQNNKDEDMLIEALSFINNYYIINFDPNFRDIKIHRFVQEILRRHLRECDPDMQAACYGACVEALLQSRYWHYNILRFSDENSITFDKFYRKHKHELCFNQYGKLLKGILVVLIESNCIKSLRILLDDILGFNLFNFFMCVRKCMCIRTCTYNYISSFKLLHGASTEDSIDAMKLLVLEFHFDVNSRDFKKDTPLHVAADWWNFKGIRFLVENEANVNARNWSGETPLFLFFRNAPRDEHTVSDDVKEILDLLNCQQQIHTRTDFGNSLLHAAAMGNNLGLMKLLILDYNYDIDCRNNYQETPLHTAASFWNFESIRFLKEQNADVNATDRSGETPLFKFTSNAYSPQHFNLEEVKIHLSLLGCQHNDTRTTIIGGTLIHVAAGAGNTDLVTLLATHYKLDVNAQNNLSRNTPLHDLIYFASWRMHPDDLIRTAEALKRCGARLDLTDGRGRTPRQFAEEHEETKQLVPYLTESGSVSDTRL